MITISRWTRRTELNCAKYQWILHIVFLLSFISSFTTIVLMLPSVGDLFPNIDTFKHEVQTNAIQQG
ncbi:hypothetical protein V1508DRAFT_463886 [Lipomyces doorenjongii]|uniref:uncharacterized protein n=1 Tax=Lipomyces doorenjongii TaxID=383834 RepID=UPI0034CEE6AB